MITKKLDYLYNAIYKHDYKKIFADIKKECGSKNPYAVNLIKTTHLQKLVEIVNCTAHGVCGFGIGMFQWTSADRAKEVMLGYDARFKSFESGYEMPLEDRYKVEWEIYRKEIMGSQFSKVLKDYVSTKQGWEDTKQAAKNFREHYEINQSLNEVAGVYAQKLLDELHRLGAVDNNGQWNK
jgi:hypothetical protein